MNNSLQQLLFSMFSGTSSTLVYLGLGHILDFIMNAKYSNFIALITGGVLNFIMQSYAFSGKTGIHNNNLTKYLIAEIFIIMGSQLGVSYFLDEKHIDQNKLPSFLHKYYNTIVRLVVASLVFIFISFPLRKLWVFA